MLLISPPPPSWWCCPAGDDHRGGRLSLQRGGDERQLRPSVRRMSTPSSTWRPTPSTPSRRSTSPPPSWRTSCRGGLAVGTGDGDAHQPDVGHHHRLGHPRQRRQRRLRVQGGVVCAGTSTVTADVLAGTPHLHHHLHRRGPAGHHGGHRVDAGDGTKKKKVAAPKHHVTLDRHGPAGRSPAMTVTASPIPWWRRAAPPRRAAASPSTKTDVSGGSSISGAVGTVYPGAACTTRSRWPTTGRPRGRRPGPGYPCPTI